MKLIQFAAAIVLVAGCGLAHGESRLDRLSIMQDAYPRAFYFRQTEGRAAQGQMSYEEWESGFAHLDGIMGKCLDEEIPNRSLRNIAFFTRYKEHYPEKAVLLHFNGNSRDPRYETEPFFPGHWLYFNGCKVTQDVAAENDESIIHVEDSSLFLVNMGRFSRNNEDLGICMLDEAGRPDWSRSEHLQLLSVDRAAKTLKVRRGAFGSKPRAYPAGKAYIAAHVSEGPWGGNSNLLWAYNYARTCPKDAEGRTCTDLVLDDLARWFGADGPLAAFDGIEFDVLHFHPTGGGRGRGADVDADGAQDKGIVDGVNVYGLGVHDFVTRLRERFGPDRLIMADGHGVNHQRSVTALNGIESEGWPDLRDSGVADWSGGLNRHRFWRDNAQVPVFNYINHKFNEAGKLIEVPINITRLVLAAGQFTDSAITYSLVPPTSGDGREGLGVWDELCMGVENRSRWLGRPLDDAVCLGFDTPDLLEGTGLDPAQWLSGDARITSKDGALGIEGLEHGQEEASAQLSGIDVPDGDLLVRCTLRAEARAAYGPDLGRLVWCGCTSTGSLVSGDLPRMFVGVRGCEEVPLVPKGGARLEYRGQMTIKSESHDAFFTHPPYGPDQGTGYIAWEREVKVPEGAGVLALSTGLTQAPNPSDGIVFAVDLRSGDAEKRIFAFHHTDYAWRSHTVDLSPWVGQSVCLRFSADCGPDDNCTADHGYWGDVCVVRGNEAAARRPAPVPARVVTWANGKPFESWFYFRDAGPATVDLNFEIEGGEPVTVSDIRVHNASGAMVRVFEHGAVLANPSSRPYTFDLQALFPDTKLRRLQGSPKQDPVTNNGEVLGEKVTLPAYDGLFVVKAGMEPSV
jgi:hypothetical protein